MDCIRARKRSLDSSVESLSMLPIRGTDEVSFFRRSFNTIRHSFRSKPKLKHSNSMPRLTASLNCDKNNSIIQLNRRHNLYRRDLSSTFATSFASSGCIVTAHNR